MNTSSMGTVAVTGSTGLVGRAIVAHLRERGIAARLLLRSGGSPSLHPEVEDRSVDLLDVDATSEALDGCRAVIHAAGQMTGADADIERTNARSTARLLEAAQRSSVERFVYVSSVAVYGDGDLLLVDESRPRRPRSAYARSKAEAEDSLRQACASSDLEGWSLRPATIYGAGDRHFTPLLRQVATEGLIPLTRGGQVRFEVVAAEDVARACVAAAETAGGQGQALNISSGENPTLGECVRRLREHGFPARTVVVEDPSAPPPGVHPHLLAELSQDRSFSIERARTAIAYRPEVPFPEALVRENPLERHGPMPPLE